MGEKVRALATSILNALPDSLEEKEKAALIEKVESCRDFLVGFDNAAAAFLHLDASSKKRKTQSMSVLFMGQRGLSGSMFS